MLMKFRGREAWSSFTADNGLELLPSSAANAADRFRFRVLTVAVDRVDGEAFKGEGAGGERMGSS